MRARMLLHLRQSAESGMSTVQYTSPDRREPLAWVHETAVPIHFNPDRLKAACSTGCYSRVAMIRA